MDVDEFVIPLLNGEVSMNEYEDYELTSQLDRIKSAQDALDRARESASRDVVRKLSDITEEIEALIKKTVDLVSSATEMAKIAGIPYDPPNFFISLDDASRINEWEDSWGD
jgi:hypothetical protein